MTRHEFTKKTKRLALERSGGQCEAIGIRYGHKAGERCEALLEVTGVQYDHYPRGAHDPDPATRALENCTACCPACNQYAANHFDKQVEQKIKDVRRFHGLDPDERIPRRKILNREFSKAKRSFPKRTK